MTAGISLSTRGPICWRGGDRGAVVVAGKPDERLLIKAIRYRDPKLQMPPEGKLADDEIDLLVNWIADGAVVPEYGTAVKKAGTQIDRTAARQFWSFQPLQRVAIPQFVWLGSASSPTPGKRPVESLPTWGERRRATSATPTRWRIRSMRSWLQTLSNTTCRPRPPRTSGR